MDIYIFLFLFGLPSSPGMIKLIEQAIAKLKYKIYMSIFKGQLNDKAQISMDKGKLKYKI